MSGDLDIFLEHAALPLALFTNEYLVRKEIDPNSFT